MTKIYINKKKKNNVSVVPFSRTINSKIFFIILKTSLFS